MRGMTVQLVEYTPVIEGSTQVVDAFGVPQYTETLVDVNDVLVGQPSTDDINDSINLYGKKCDYVLGIPKGDTHNWVDTFVVIRGERFRTIGFPMRGIDENVPLRWYQNVRVERYVAV